MLISGSSGAGGSSAGAEPCRLQPQHGEHSVPAAAGCTEIVSLSTYLIELQMSFLMAIW